jgi:hypothetical protein
VTPIGYKRSPGCTVARRKLGSEICGPPNSTVRGWLMPTACHQRDCGQYTEYASFTPRTVPARSDIPAAARK